MSSIVAQTSVSTLLCYSLNQNACVHHFNKFLVDCCGIEYSNRLSGSNCTIIGLTFVFFGVNLVILRYGFPCLGGGILNKDDAQQMSEWNNAWFYAGFASLIFFLTSSDVAYNMMNTLMCGLSCRQRPTSLAILLHSVIFAFMSLILYQYKDINVSKIYSSTVDAIKDGKHMVADAANYVTHETGIDAAVSSVNINNKVEVSMDSSNQGEDEIDYGTNMPTNPSFSYSTAMPSQATPDLSSGAPNLSASQNYQTNSATMLDGQDPLSSDFASPLYG